MGSRPEWAQGQPSPRLVGPNHRQSLPPIASYNPMDYKVPQGHVGMGPHPSEYQGKMQMHPSEMGDTQKRWMQQQAPQNNVAELP